MSREQSSPLRLILILLAVIFCVEIAVHFVVPHGVTPWVEAIADATVLTGVVSLFVWWLFMEPLEVALKGEAARAKAVTDTAAEGIVTIDERGVIESFNPAAERMFARRAREVIGQNVRIVMPEPHASAHDGYIARYIRTGEARMMGRSRELSALRKDGTEFPVEVNLTEVRFGGERYFTAILRDITQRKEAEERIRHLAHYDSLTDLPSRALFYDRLTQAMGLAKRDRNELALLYLDLDRFKAVNDTLGHDAGDELLKSVAERIRRAVRGSDTVARLAGDEFVVILPKIASREDAAEVARKVIDALSARFHLGSRKQEVGIGTSIGIAIYPADAEEIDALVKAADTAMYNAKQVRNAFRFCEAQTASTS